MKTKAQGIPIPKVATRCTESERIRKVDNKINKNKTQEHLVTTQAHRGVPGKPGATTLTAEYSSSRTTGHESQRNGQKS